jgi:tRNA pseudouridine55 synthase
MHESQAETHEPSGLLIIDKPRGPTSHDVVSKIRRTLGTRSVGHAGTLDPMATGVLVVMVGPCTKLSRFLTLEDKVYRTTVLLGQGTDTLDAEGVATDSAPVPATLIEALARMERGHLDVPADSVLADALGGERARTSQVPPMHSAIKQDGVASYERARRGEQVELPTRDVRVVRLDVVGASVDPPTLALELHVTKGYYVRSLARDLGEALGLPAHLVALRRIRSGSFGLEGAVALGADAATMRYAMLSVEQAARECLASATLTSPGVLRALRGQTLEEQDFEQAPGEAVSAWFAPGGRLVAVGDRSRGRPTVLRAFLHVDEMC